jgi:ferric-dicitrate binding protein FerR (iron transport regulator)
VHIDDERLYLLLDRYLAGEASAVDTEAVREWLAEDAEHAVLLEDLRLIRGIAREQAPRTSVDVAWGRAALEIRPKPGISRRLLVAVLAAAAVVVALIGGPGVLRRAPRWSEHATAAAHRAVIRLRDGTQVTLAPASHLRYATDYGRVQRDVYLDGEAYFQVTPDSQRPFRVHTPGSVTEDLGTAFVVRAYSEQRATEVVVTEGRVSLSRGDTTPHAVVLGLRDLGRLDASGGGPATVRRGVDVDRYLAWTKGVLTFDGAPLRDVVPALERWYAVDIQLPDSTFVHRRLTATFRDEPIDLVLQRIALTLGLRVEHADGGEAVFVFRKAR